MVFTITHRNWNRLEKIYPGIFKNVQLWTKQATAKIFTPRNSKTSNKTKNKLAVRNKTLVRKKDSLITYDYKNMKMTKILMITLTTQLRKIVMKKRISHPPSIREPDIDFRVLVDKLEQAETTMKPEKTGNWKLQYVSNVQTQNFIY